MIFQRKCKHPFDYLVVERDHSEKQLPGDEDFMAVDYYLLCTKCHEKLTLKYAKLIGTTDEFLARKKKDE